MDPKEIVMLMLSLFVCLLAAAIGATFTIPGISAWYATLNKPFFNPPDWLFAPVWTALYILMGLALFLVWRAPKVKHTNEALTLFGAQLILNIMWSIVFFGFKSMSGSVLVIMILLVLVLLTIARFYMVDRRAAYLLVPYVLWVGFATALNISIYLMNP